MKSITTIGIDLAKNSFSLYGVNAKGKCVLKKSLHRMSVIRFFANLLGSRLSRRLQRGFIVCEPLASGPPNALITPTQRLPRK